MKIKKTNSLEVSTFSSSRYNTLLPGFSWFKSQINFIEKLESSYSDSGMDSDFFFFLTESQTAVLDIFFTVHFMIFFFVCLFACFFLMCCYCLRKLNKLVCGKSNIVEVLHLFSSSVLIV